MDAKHGTLSYDGEVAECMLHLHTLEYSTPGTNHVTNAILYGDLPRVGDKMAAWRMYTYLEAHKVSGNQPTDTGGQKIYHTVLMR